ncbi:MAG: hypothetical protein EOO61_13455 [Hymenobacter sp.]|nr:MAG: hypothetical protein EOO61_13455 [Hymenobacter sp.]
MLLFKTSFIWLTLGVVLSCTSCKNLRNQTPEASEQQKQHAAYDDSTLNRNTLPVMMPYNRLIDPAGTVVTYGNPELENHSLDLMALPGTNYFAVEDRYGIAILDTKTHHILTQWAYTAEPQYKGFMSTYSGIQVRQRGTQTQIFWSAANPNNHESAVFEATWNGKSIRITNTFSFKPEAPSPLALPNEVAVQEENGKDYLYVVLNGNNKLVKIAVDSKAVVWSVNTGVSPYGIAVCNGKMYVTNWGGNVPEAPTGQQIS